MNWIDAQDFDPPPYLEVLLCIRSLKNPMITYITTGHVDGSEYDEDGYIPLAYKLNCFDNSEYEGARTYTLDLEVWKVTHWSLQPELPKEFQ